MCERCGKVRCVFLAILFVLTSSISPSATRARSRDIEEYTLANDRTNVPLSTARRPSPGGPRLRDIKINMKGLWSRLRRKPMLYYQMLEFSPRRDRTTTPMQARLPGTRVLHLGRGNLPYHPRMTNNLRCRTWADNKSQTSAILAKMDPFHPISGTISNKTCPGHHPYSIPLHSPIMPPLSPIIAHRRLPIRQVMVRLSLWSLLQTGAVRVHHI